MQFPIDLHFGAVTIPSHFIFDTLAIFLAVRYYLVLRERAGDNLPDSMRMSVMIGGLVGALVGAKLIAMADAVGTPIFETLGISYLLLGGKTIVGALAGGIVGVEIAKWISKEKRSSGDLFVFPLIYGMIIGRMGCFLTGVSDETAGLPSILPWALDQGDGILRHPTAAYEILFLCLLWIVLTMVKKRYHLVDGMLFRLFVLGYFSFRLLVDFIKPVNHTFLGFTPIQLVCLAFIAWYAVDVISKVRTYGIKSSA